MFGLTITHCGRRFEHVQKHLDSLPANPETTVTKIASTHCYPPADPARRPSHLWYWGRSVYVSRRDYWRIFLGFLSAGIPLGLVGVLAHSRTLLDAAFIVAAIGLALFTYSLFGLYRMYGHPSMRYFRQLLDLGRVRDGATIADLHIGTYRTAFALADLLPASTIHTIDCWNPEEEPDEAAVADVRDLEPPPTANPRVRPRAATPHGVSLPDASCDVVVLGFGTHEIPEGPSRELLFDETTRVLRPGGTVLMFEHGKDLHNFLIFGPVIDHVTSRAAWLDAFGRHFTDVRSRRSSAAVDLIAATRRA